MSSLEGKKVRRKFPGTGWFDGVVLGGTDGGAKYTVQWNDGSTTTMKAEAVLKYSASSAADTAPTPMLRLFVTLGGEQQTIQLCRRDPQ